MEFKERSHLVTGGGQGIGKATALALAGEGADVVVNDLNLDLAERTAKEVKAIGPRAMAIQANVALEKEVEAMVARVVAEWGGIDILVNNAGTGRPMMVEDMDKSEWDRILNINLGGVFNCSRAVIPTMKSRGGGKIVNIASFAAKTMSYHGGADYTASKAAVLGFTRHLAFELGPHGINVNAICPGVTMTPLLSKLLSGNERIGQKPDADEGSCKARGHRGCRHLPRIEEARMITGSTIDVDGGISLGLQDWDTYVRTRKEL